MGDSRLQLLMDSLGYDYHVHGLRSTFSTWVAEKNLNDYIIAREISLDHRVGGTVYRAYDRSDRFEQRRELTELYVRHLLGEDLSS
jgi:integrase